MESDPRFKTPGAGAEEPSGPRAAGPPTETLDDATPAARPAGGAAPIFSVDEIVSGRYRIVRFVARGGAGDVYEAEDLELDSRVALKAVRSDYTSETRIARFKREVQLARQVTHPNVCRIYELGHEEHLTGDVLFLTMEYLEGETLHERLNRGGPMPVATALPLVRQMAAGLRAAQKAGVVHRDFKSGNVMLVPDAESECGLRTVITDFGLAKATSPDKDGKRVTASNLMLGTPAYMAPEQVGGEPVSAATDLYAFGIVMFEMLTGHTPFDSDSGIGTAVLRLHEPPPSPRVYLPDVDERWERVILRCLERNPEDRFSTSDEIVAALTARDGEAEASSSEGFLGSRFRGLAAVALLAALLAALAGFFGGRASRTESAPPERTSVAVLGFRNLSGDEEAAWLSTAFVEMLATEAAAGEKVRVVRGEDVARARTELALDEGEGPAPLPPERLQQVGDLLGADLVVVGSYLLAGDRELRLDLQVQDTHGGEVLATISDRGTEAGVLDLVERVGEDLRQLLGVGSLSSADEAAMRASLPGGPASARLYARGLRALRRYDARAARDVLEQAVASDPENPLIHSALSAAWGSLGYHPEARQAARRAFDLSGSLGRRDRMWVEARYHDVAGDRREAASIYGLLWEFYPDELEYGLRLAKAQTGLGLPERALETVARLRERPVAAGIDPRIDIAEAEAARALARYDLQQARAAEAAGKAEALQARLLAARAREVEAGAWRELGEPERALTAYEEAREIYEVAGHRGQVARTLIAVSKIHRQQGRFEEAVELLDRALAVAREIGDQGSVKHALNTLAIIYRQQGQLTTALRMHLDEVAAAREIGDPRSLSVALTSLGTVERQTGDLEAARGRFEEALQLSRASGNKRSIAINLNLVGQVLAVQGRVAEARPFFEEALSLNEETGSRRGRGYYLASLGSVARLAGDLAVAREYHAEALAVRRGLGESTNVAYSLLELAEVDLAAGAPARAAVRARAAARVFASQGKSDAEGLSELALARAWLAYGRVDEAQAAVASAASKIVLSEDPGMRVQVSLRTGEVEAAAGRLADARRQLTEALRDAEALGLVVSKLEASLLLGEIELRSGDRSGRRRLEGIAAEASSLGCHLLARRAEERLAGPLRGRSSLRRDNASHASAAGQ